MCGIALVLASALGSSLSSHFSCLHHRGPDGSKTVTLDCVPPVALSVFRLAIMPPNEGESPQPFSITSSFQRKTWLVVNGEIYNHGQIFEMVRDSGDKKGKNESQNDCDSVLAAFSLASPVTSPSVSSEWFVTLSSSFTLPFY